MERTRSKRRASIEAAAGGPLAGPSHSLSSSNAAPSKKLKALPKSVQAHKAVASIRHNVSIPSTSQLQVQSPGTEKEGNILPKEKGLNVCNVPCMSQSERKCKQGSIFDLPIFSLGWCKKSCSSQLTSSPILPHFDNAEHVSDTSHDTRDSPSLLHRRDPSGEDEGLDSSSSLSRVLPCTDDMVGSEIPRSDKESPWKSFYVPPIEVEDICTDSTGDVCKEKH